MVNNTSATLEQIDKALEKIDKGSYGVCEDCSERIPLERLRGSGVAADPEAYFDKVVFTGSHDAAILAVLDGEADLGACKNTVFEALARTRPDVRRAITVLAESAAVPQNSLGLRPDLPEEVRESLRDAFLGMERSEEGKRVLRRFGAQRFITTSFEDYRPVFEMAREAGLDLAQWPLRDTR